MPPHDIKGHQVIIDDEDSDLLEFKWQINKGYAVRSAKPKQMHRIILERKIGRSLEKGELCDHADGNRLNNSRSNLRVANHAQNIWNSNLNPKSITGYRGIYIASLGRTWDAMIRVNGKMIKLGRFTDIREALKAYNTAALEHYGEFARLNPVPDEDPYAELKTLTEDQIRALTYMNRGGLSFFINGLDSKKAADALVEMGLATCTIKTRVEEYAHYEATEAGRKLFHPDK